MILHCAALAIALSGRVSANAAEVFVDVVWNGQFVQRALAVIEDDDVLLPAAELKNLGVNAPVVKAVAGSDYASLRALKPHLSYTFDTRTFVLTIATDRTLLPVRSISISRNRPVLEAAFVRALAMNYGIYALSGQRLSSSLQQRYSFSPGVTFENTAGINTEGRIARGFTDLSIDDTERMRHLVIGDSVISDGALDESATIAGVSVQRDFSLDPYRVTYPAPSVQTTISQPSVAEIYVNGALVRTMDLSPGLYDLDDIPIEWGYTNARVVIRNQFGGSASDIRSYGAPTLLRPGLTDYQYALGFLRSNTGASGDRYGPAVFSSRYRIGSSAFTTLGGGAQFSNGVFDYEIDAGARSGFGFFQGGIAQSRSLGAAGNAYFVDLSSSGTRNAVALQARVQSPGYVQIGMPSTNEETLERAYQFTWLERLDVNTSLILDARYDCYARAGEVRSARVSISRRMRQWQLQAGYSGGSDRGPTPHRVSDVSFELTRVIGGSTSVTVASDSGGNGPEVEVAHGSPEIGTSYAAYIQPGGATPLSARVAFGLPAATADIAVTTQRFGAPAWSGDVTGSIVRWKGQTLLGQAIGDAFAIVDADGVRDASLYLNDAYAGRTNKSGLALVPFLASNEDNMLALSDAGLPIQDVIEGQNRHVGPRRREGSYVRFNVRRMRAVFGTIRIRDKSGARVPVYGDVEVAAVNGSKLSSPTDELGEFYFGENAPGSYSATVYDAIGECRFNLKIPAFVSPRVELGTIECDA